MPVRDAVTVPAAKSPEASRATIAEAVFASVAVVAELETLPTVEIVASFVSTIAAEALMSALTIVASAIIVDVTVPLGRVTVPVKVGEARFALRSRAVCWAVDTGLFASEVLSTLARPTSPLTRPVGAVIEAPVGIVTVPVNVGEARLALRSRAVCVAVETGLLASLVLSAFPKPTSPLTKPEGEVIVLLVNVCEPVVVTRIDVSAMP